MKGKLKAATIVAGVMLTCALSTGALIGCGGDAHTHDYTKWGTSATEHWKECPDDGAVDESTKETHVFIAGECECGATEQTGPIENAEYGTVTGAVRLYKQGAYVTDALSGVQVDMGDDDVEISGSVADGKYTFTVENVKVDKSYMLIISRMGYQSYSTEIMLEEEGEEAKIGGTNGVTLNYEMFKVWAYDASGHDFTHVNDEEPYIGFNGKGVTFDALSVDKYGDVSASINANSASGGSIQGIVLKFEDGTAAILALNAGERKWQYRPNTWEMKSVWGEKIPGTDNDQWFEDLTVVTQDVIDKFNGDGVEVRIVRKGGTLYTFLDGVFVNEKDLPEARKNDEVQVGFYSHDAKAGGVWAYNISEDVGEMQSTLNISVTNPEDGTECTVTANPQKDVYALGEQVELTFTAPDGYKLDALTVGGADRFGDVVNGKLTVKADRNDLRVEATFVKEEPIALDLTVKGLKLGTTAVLADDTIVTFKNTDYSFTVTNGKITNDSVKKGRYTVHVDGYFEKEITLDENLTEITLEYDLFKIVRWDTDGHGLSHVNEEASYIEWKGPGASLNAVTKQNMLGDATVSVTLKGSQTTNNEKQQGILLRFDDGKAAILNINTDASRPRLQFRPELFSDENDASIGLHTAFTTGWVEFNNVTADELAKYNSETGIVLKVVREGALLYVFIDDAYHGTAVLPSDYADSQMGFGFFAYDAVVGAQWYFEVSDVATRASATVTDETAADANGSITGVPTESVKVGDEITLTIESESGYKLKTLTVGGVDVTANITGTTYKFTVTGNTTVVAEFTEIIPGSINAVISGNKFGIAGNTITSSDTVTLSASGFDAITANLTADGNDFKLVVQSIAAGTWTLKIDGYQSVEITVAENGEYATAIVLTPEEEFTLIQGWGAVNSVVKADGSADLTITNEMETSVSKTGYDDIAVTVYLSGSNMTKDGNMGTQGIVFRFSDDKLAILRMEGRQKIQFACSTEWYQGATADGCSWQDLIFFTDAGENTVKDKYLTAFDKGELILTAVRKGATIYAILTVDGNSEIIGCRTLADKYLTDKARVGMYCEGTVNGAAKTWKFAIGDADTALASATPIVGTDMTSYLGSWTNTDSTLAVSGKGMIEFKSDAGTVKESVTIKISAANGPDEQGIIYRFADGKFVAIRYQNSTEAATPHGKVQFTMDTVLFTNASLINWGSDYGLTEAEKTAFDGEGIDLTLVRDGNKFYVVLGERTLGTQTVDETKYAAANGNMGIMMWNGKNVAFAYDHKMGDDVTVPVVTE